MFKKTQFQLIHIALTPSLLTEMDKRTFLKTKSKHGW